MSQTVPACSGDGGNTNTPSPSPNSNSKHWGFTLNNPTIEEEDRLRIYFKEHCSKFRAQEEIGENGTRHLQGYARFPAKKRFTALKKLCSRCHWFMVKKVEEYVEYVCKKDTATGRAWGNIRPLKLVEPNRPWQQQLLKDLQEEPNDRTVIWYYDQKGGAGKTTVQRWVKAHMNAIIVCGKGSDMKFGVQNYVATDGCAPDIVILNIPRATDSQYISYQGIEELKDGIFFSPKYESADCLFNPPHVVVFANCLPNKAMLTDDRWDIRIL